MRKIGIQQKLTNHVMKNGEKKTSEKIILQSFKELQKNSLKKTNEIVKLALIYSIPVFKLNIIKNKKVKKNKQKLKEIPSFITNNNSRISLAIKFILKTIKKKKEIFYNKLNKELFLNSQKKGETIQIKNILQKEILKKKRYLKFYRWK
jgi:ribosomal protein S7